MQERTRQVWLPVAGLLAVGVLAVGAYLAWSRAAPKPPAMPVFHSQASPAPVVQAAVAPTPTPSTCAFDPMVPAGGARDGKFALESALALHRSADPAPFLAVADESARDARPRDTEVALIAACRIAGQAGANAAPVADVQTRLAHHYAALARQAPEGEARTGLMARAEELLQSTVQTYAGALGRESSKARLAQQRLAALRQPAPVVVAQPSAPIAPADPTASMGASRLSLADRPPAPTEDVADLDRDLQRLYAQASAVSKDPAGMQRRHQQAMAARSACRDDACLRGWYAQRKRQLFAEF